MRKRMFLLIRIKLLVLLFCFHSPSLWSQEDNAFLQFRFIDSIEADNETSFLRNNITITNIYQYPLRFTVHLAIPKGFSLISRNDVSIELAAGEVYIMPLTLSKEKTAPADKQTVLITAEINNPATRLSYNFSINCKEIQELRIFPVKNNFQVAKDQRSVRLALKIKNIGNVTNDFFVHYTSKNLQVDKKIWVALPAFTDTLIYYDYTIPLTFIRDMETERIVASVGNDTNFLSFSFLLSKIRNNNTSNHSAYFTMPITLETGFFNSNAELSYFWGIGGALMINKDNSLSFSYRSKQYGINSVQHDIFSVFYKHKKWDLSIGQMADSRNFVVNGLGVQLNYQKNETEGFSLSAISNLTSENIYYKNQALIATTAYSIGKLFWSGLFEINQDPVSKTTSAVFNNKLTVLKKQNLNLDISLGSGMEQQRNGENKNELWGFAYGYDFRYNTTKWDISSYALVNDNNFPGIYKGWRNINQSIGYNISKHFSAGLFYNSNYTKQNFFIDSVYYNNRFLYNLTTYGLKMGWTTKPLSLFISLGNAKASGPLLINNLPEYHSVSAGLFIPITRYARFNFNSTINYNRNYGAEQESVLYYVHNGAFISKYGGVNFYITRMPTISGNFEGNFLNGYRNSSSISPYINFSFLRRRINGRAQYSFYQTTEDGRINKTQALLGNLSYSDIKKGIDIQLYGNYALKSTQPLSNFISLSIHKSFNVPIITSRKYFDLNLVFYEDINGNGRRDVTDSLVSDLLVSINNGNFISNKKGAIVSRNIEKGVYHLDFHEMKNQKGLIPSQGFSQVVTVNGQTTADIAFTKGKVIKGSIGLSLDTLSSNTFSVGQLKVSAMDSMGNKFTTFTDDEGLFQLNVPAGNYIVSLNPDAYDDVFKPIQMAFPADLLKNETYTVSFHVRQKSRKVNRIKAEIN